MRASVSGTPQWLLKDFSAACVGPRRDRQLRSASLVPVLPTLPVTATMRASRAAAGSGGDAAQALQGFAHAQQRAIAVDALVFRSDERRRGTLAEGFEDEVVAVAHVAQGDEHLARLQRARVDGKPGERNARRAIGRADGRRHQLVPGPQSSAHA